MSGCMSLCFADTDLRHEVRESVHVLTACALSGNHRESGGTGNNKE